MVEYERVLFVVDTTGDDQGWGAVPAEATRASPAFTHGRQGSVNPAGESESEPWETPPTWEPLC